MRNIMRLGDVASYINGFPFKPSDWSDMGVPIIRIQDLTGNGYQMNRFDGKYDAKYEVRAGDVLISWSASLGVYVWKLETAVLNQHIFKVRFDKVDVDKDFFVYQVECLLKKAAKQAHGATMRHLTKPVFDGLPFYLPPKEEQKRIAVQLNAITHLISLRQRQAEKLDELVKARFVEMFGDPVRNTKHWEKASLLALGSCKNGMSFHANESGIKLRCLGVGDFKNLSYIDDVEQLPFVSLAEKPSPNCFLHDGDIVFVRSNGNKALVGRCLLVYPRDTPTIYSGFCIRYRLVTEKVDPIYALHVLKADGIRQKMSGRGANIQNLNQKILAAIEMPIPPLPLQNAFATFVYEVDREKERIQRSAALLETLKRSLMQQYFG